MVLVGAGLGRLLVGVVRGRSDLAASGGWLIAAGLVAFVVFAAFFEVVIGIGGIAAVDARGSGVTQLRQRGCHRRRGRERESWFASVA